MPNQDPTQNPNPVNPPVDQPVSPIVPPAISPQSDLPPLSPDFQNLPENDVPATPSVSQSADLPTETPAQADQPISNDAGSSAPPDISSVISKPKKKFGGGKIIATILGLIVLIGGVGAGIVLTQQKQLFQQKASGTVDCGAQTCNTATQVCCISGCKLISEGGCGETSTTKQCSSDSEYDPNFPDFSCRNQYEGYTYCSPISGTDQGYIRVCEAKYINDQNSPQQPDGTYYCHNRITNTPCNNPHATPTPVPASTPTPPPPASPPTCSGATFPDCITPGTSFTVTANGVSNATQVKFPTWSSANGQDDIVWYTSNGAPWQVSIPQSSHLGGDINVHVYMYNNSYTDVSCDGKNSIPLCTTPITPPESPPITPPESPPITPPESPPITPPESPPVVPPALPPAPSCIAVKAYDSTWTFIPDTQLPSLTVGATVNFCVSGNAASGTFDKAQFMINNILKAETTTPRPGTNDLCQTYTILSIDTTVSVRAKIHNSTGVWVGESI
ncbi:MAG: GBS Bsp-like repeat-containing protein [Candidatus Woesebacteria bacterium]|nr:GBS Bsp-like repeat-containing protein [Candidatus Woesebacteria bacterium]